MRHLLVLAAIWNGNPWRVLPDGTVETWWPQPTAVVPTHLYWAIAPDEANQRSALQITITRGDWDRSRRQIGMA